jgi:hypothetical protein
MIVDKGGDIFDYYISILRKNCENDYGFLKAEQSIVGNPQVFRSSLLGIKPSVLKGTSDGDPILGMSYTINGSWKTSKVEKIIDDCIIITSNSVYAIHNLSDIRNKKIEGLGI